MAASTGNASVAEAGGTTDSPIAARAWIGALLPAAGWIADFLARTFLTRHVSVHARRWPLTLSTAAGILAVAIGVAVCLQVRRQVRRWQTAMGTGGDTVAAGIAHESIATIAGWGLALAAFFLLLILAEAYPVLVLAPQEIA